MKTTEDILANWEEEQYTERYVVQSYNPISGNVTPMCITESLGDARRFAGDLMADDDQTGRWNPPYYRIISVLGSEAKAILESVVSNA